MSQILGFLTAEKGYICADSGITDFSGKSLLTKTDKVFFCDNFAITSAGMSFGINIMESMVKHGNNAGFSHIDDGLEYLLKFGQQQYETYLRNYKKTIKKEYWRLYFILIGADGSGGLAIRMAGAEGGEELRQFPVGGVITAPRRLVFEMALLKNKDSGEKEISGMISENFKKLAVLDSTISPPFTLAVVSVSGKACFQKIV